MKEWSPAWRLAAFVLVVWGFAVVIDAFSASYEIPDGLHTGCGIILGVLISAGTLQKRNGGDK